QTRLRDLAPVCTHCHHDLHEGHATLRLRDGRLINDHGWVRPAGAAFAVAASLLRDTAHYRRRLTPVVQALF
ncbi:MAG: hypothetical protein ACR2K2_05405, partial [Mycobacteriales bacterium]